MAATTPRLQAGPATGPRPRRRTPALRLIGPWQNAAEGAAAVLCAVLAMAAVAAPALALLGAGAYGSLWPLTMLVTALAVGGSASAGPAPSADSGATGGLASLFGGGGGMSPSTSGAVQAVPLTVTLVGAAVLWVAFSWRLRAGRQRRFTAGELAVRAAGAAVAAPVAFLAVAGLARGTATLPEGALSGMAGPGGGSAAGGPGDLLGGGGGGGGLAELFGGGGTAAPSALTYQVSAGAAGVGAVLWVAVALGAGCLISRRARLPLGGALDALRSGWGRSLSAVVRTLLALAAVPLVVLVFVGAAAGGRAGDAAGAALLFAPNAVAVLLTLGVGTEWTAAVHPVRGEGGNPLAALIGGMGGTGGGDARQTDRTEQLRSLSAGGWPLWLAALAVTGLVLLCCAYRAARATDPAHRVPPHSCRGPLAAHLGMAERFGVVTAVTLATAARLAGASGRFGVALFGSELGGMRAELGASVLRTVVLGLLAGAAAGFAGSLAATARRPPEPR
ncbi:streptophobe family protein [Streptomyces phaeofaciens]|uniref:streptophobe family protein n=1 Tax=Streptomyces phaeofaciens TaxID=68254 RepID=UPI00167670F1|nr:streptophobe family protein [Streptomyces phaeofaciens]